MADWETGHASASQPVRPEFELLERNAPVQEITAVAVAVAQRDAEQPWRHQGAIHGGDRERHRQAIIGAQPGDSNGMRHSVIGHRSDLRRMEIGSRTRITEVFAFRLEIAIVLMEVEMGAASLVAGHIAVSVCGVTASAASARAWDKVIGANDIDQIEQVAADRAVEDGNASHGGVNAAVRCGMFCIQSGERHRARGDAVEPVRRERRDAGVEAHVGDRDVDCDGPERPEHERAGAGRGDLLRSRIRQRRASAD